MKKRKSHIMYFFHQLRKGSAQLFLIYKPVAKTGEIIIPFSKPSIIQYQHIQIQFCRFFCNCNQIVFVKIKIGCFPVIYQNRAHSVFPAAADQIRHDCLMQSLGQL